MHEFNDYKFYFKIDICHYERYSNSSHQDTNKGLKHFSGALVPLNKFDKSLTKLCNQATRRCELRNQAFAKEVSHNKTWSKLKCAGKLNTLCVSILEGNISNCSNYKTVKVERDKWLVLRTTPYVKSVIPRFKQTHTVRSKKGVFFCSCKYFERNGIPCHYQLAVLQTLPHYEAPSHHDVSVVWWSHYIYHREPKNTCCDNKEAERDSPSRMDDLSLFYKYIETNDVKGPAYDQKYIDAAPVVSIVPQEFHDSLRVPNCINYDTSNISISEEDRCPFGYIHATNVKQHSNVTLSHRCRCRYVQAQNRTEVCGKNYLLVSKNL